jgi:hypothetical protein
MCWGCAPKIKVRKINYLLIPPISLKNEIHAKVLEYPEYEKSC